MRLFLYARALPVAAATAILGAVAPVSAMTAAPAGSSAAVAARAAFRPVFGPVSRYSLSNWGGYIAHSKSAKFTSAAAHWTIATVTCTSDNDFYAPWVGIDGYGDSTVEQIGVATTCSKGSQGQQAWYVMYPASPVYFDNPVSAGDVISASVTYKGGEYTLKISDVTKGWTRTVHKKLAAAKRLSAEAIIEAPAGGGTFPGIKSVDFTGVEFNHKPLASFDPTASDTGTKAIEYIPSAITDNDDFSMVPKS